MAATSGCCARPGPGLCSASRCPWPAGPPPVSAPEAQPLGRLREPATLAPVALGGAAEYGAAARFGTTRDREEMEDVARWIWCGVTGLMGVLGLFVSAGARSEVGYWGGLGFFALAVLFVM